MIDRVRPAEAASPIVRHGRMLGYASGNFGKNVLASTMDVFLLFLLTERWGVTPSVAGLVVMIGLLWDGLCDPLVGRLFDRSADPPAAYRRLLFLGAPVVGLFFTLFFVDPRWHGGSVLVWAIAITLLFRTAYSVCDVAHNALMLQMTRASGSATTVSGLRYMFSCLGAVAVAASAGAFVSPTPHGHPSLVAVTSIAAFAFVATLWISAAAVLPSPRNPLAGVRPPALGWIVANRSLLVLFALGFVQALTLPVLARSFAYLGKGVLRDPAWTGTALTVLAVAQLLSLPLWMALARRIGRRGMIALALMILAVGLVVFVLDTTAMIAGIALFGIGNAGVQIMLWVMLSEAIDDGARATGVRLDGLPVALLLLVLKAGGGLSGAMLGQGLSLLGWTADRPITLAAQGHLLHMAAGIPLVGALLCLGIVALDRPSPHG
jgi:GPH family glycoside/pentoside/hexuronide:cation symporter